MCGIVGLVWNQGVDGSRLQRMCRILKHRGPDDEGYALIGSHYQAEFFRGDDTIPELAKWPHINEVSAGLARRVGLAHRRLSIIDLSSAGHQPLSIDNGRYIITYNGEVYNYRELKQELVAKGHTFRSDSDTEVILRSYKEWGEGCVERFIGMWAFAILDLSSRRLMLSRDRFGIKPLYYSLSSDGLVFASEIKALFEAGCVERKADPVSVCEYLSFGSLGDSHKTLFKDIFELPPGYNLWYDVETLSVRLSRYYDLAAVVHLGVDKAQGGDPLSIYEALLDDSVTIHLRSDVPVGSCLSGGLDSSAIVAFSAPKLNGCAYNTFTAAYKDSREDESCYARMVSSHFANVQAYYTYPSASGYWEEIDQLVWHQDLPINSTSMFASWEVMKLAANQRTKVLLDGQGADETLGGYTFFGGLYLLSQLKRGRWLHFVDDALKLKENRSLKIWREIGRAAFHALPSMVQKRVANARRIGLNFIAPDFRWMLREIDVPQRIGHTFRETSLLNIKDGLQELLRYEDRNSMAFSIETRVPFLDHRLVEFSLELEDRWKIREGWSKYILRKAAEPHLPSEVTWRRDKKGFVTPQREWKQQLRDAMTTYVQNYDYPKLLNKDFILEMSKTDLPHATHLSEYWRLFSFLKWKQVFNVKL